MLITYIYRSQHLIYKYFTRIKWKSRKTRRDWCLSMAPWSRNLIMLRSSTLSLKLDLPTDTWPPQVCLAHAYSVPHQFWTFHLFPPLLCWHYFLSSPTSMANMAESEAEQMTIIHRPVINYAFLGLISFYHFKVFSVNWARSQW